MKLSLKLKNKSGFSLVESMVALAVVALLTIGIITGVNAASSIYNKSIFNSESEILATTIDVALADILRFSTEISETNGVISFTNGNYGVVKGHLLLNGNWLYLNLTDEKADDDDTAPLIALLNGGIYTSMKVSSFKLDYADGLFSGEYKIESKENSSLVRDYKFNIRTLC